MLVQVLRVVLAAQERNVLENVQKWACGRPAPSELMTAGSDAPDEAGLMDLDPGAMLDMVSSQHAVEVA